MTRYPAELRMKDALRRYFDDNGFGPDGGYAAAWVEVKLGPIPLALPNTDARRRAVRFHDLHHIVTGYETNTTGEFEISAWELASGCKDFVAAWQLNLGAFFVGVLAAPVRTFRAFVRGRHSENLYGSEYERDLALTVGEVTARLRTDRPVHAASIADFAWFAIAALAGAAVVAAMLPLAVPVSLIALPALQIAARRARAAG